MALTKGMLFIIAGGFGLTVSLLGGFVKLFLLARKRKQMSLSDLNE